VRPPKRSFKIILIIAPPEIIGLFFVVVVVADFEDRKGFAA